MVKVVITRDGLTDPKISQYSDIDANIGSIDFQMYFIYQLLCFGLTTVFVDFHYSKLYSSIVNLFQPCVTGMG